MQKIFGLLLIAYTIILGEASTAQAQNFDGYTIIFDPGDPIIYMNFAELAQLGNNPLQASISYPCLKSASETDLKSIFQFRASAED